MGDTAKKLKSAAACFPERCGGKLQEVLAAAATATVGTAPEQRYRKEGYTSFKPCGVRQNKCPKLYKGT